MKLYGSDLSVFVNKIRFVLNYLDLDYEYVRLSIPEGQTRTKEFLAKNPVGKIPVLEDGNFILWESNAVIKYLARKSDSDIYPKSLREQAIVDQWIDFSTLHVGNAMMKVFFNVVMAPRLKREVDQNSLKDGWTFLKRFLPICDQQLSQRSFLASDSISLADFSLLAVLDPCEVIGLKLGDYPALDKWRKELILSEFYQKTYHSFSELLNQ